MILLLHWVKAGHLADEGLIEGEGLERSGKVVVAQIREGFVGSREVG